MTKRAKSVSARAKGKAGKERAKAILPQRWKKGERPVGRAKGTKNKLGVRLKEAILEAAEKSGRDGKGKDGAVGYLVWLSRAEPAVFGRMLEKVMPLQVDVKDTTHKLSAPEAVARLKERGIPVPPALESLAAGVALAVQERQDEDYEDELNGVGSEDEEPAEENEDDDTDAG
jgi:hypothetical protein